MTNPSPLKEILRIATSDARGWSHWDEVANICERALSQEADSTAPASDRAAFEAWRDNDAPRGSTPCWSTWQASRATLSSTAPVVSSDEGAIRGVINELRWYNPAADAYRGKHIHKGWADRLDAALAAAPLPSLVQPVAPRPTEKQIERAWLETTDTHIISRDAAFKFARILLAAAPLEGTTPCK